jgi:hypothetical protein
MRGSIVVLALVASPFLAASAQRHTPHRTLVPASAKCDPRARGNSENVASQKGLDHRADPTAKGNKQCPVAQPPGGGDTGGGTTGDPAPTPTGNSFVSGMLYNDPDGIGAFDGSQFGLGGWTVQLSGPAGVLSTTTDGNGNYSFSNVAAGSYSLCVVPPGGWIATGPLAGVSCPSSSFGYTIDAPADVAFDVYFSDYNFGFKSAPW